MRILNLTPDAERLCLSRKSRLRHTNWRQALQAANNSGRSPLFSMMFFQQQSLPGETSQ